MQIDQEGFSMVSGVISSIAATAIGWGVLKTKVGRLERDIDSMTSRFVSTELFNAIITTMKEDLHEMKIDIKKVLEKFNK